jgi:prepilin-type N-terminal cleavage/methylation domain-containing protein
MDVDFSKKEKGFTRKNFLKKNLDGFTLIEILVVISIIAIMSSFIFIRPRGATDLEIAARQIVTDLRQAQSMAMAAKTRETPCEYVPCGYGIYFSTSTPSQYVLFEDFGFRDCAADPIVTCPGNFIKNAGEEIEIISLPDGIELVNSGNIIFSASSGIRITTYSTTTIRRKDEPTDIKNIIIKGDGSIEIQ